MSAVNKKAAQQVENRDKLDDFSLAVCPMDFAAASYASAENDVISPSEQSWASTVYEGKDKSVIAFLSACGFEDFDVHGMNEAPTMDSIGYPIASKEIHVSDEETQTGKPFALVAFGIRGAGYGAEWARNVTIGYIGSKGLPDNGRHYGLDSNAQEICSTIRAYLDNRSITGDVKLYIIPHSDQKSGFYRGKTAGIVSLRFLFYKKYTQTPLLCVFYITFRGVAIWFEKIWIALFEKLKESSAHAVMKTICQRMMLSSRSLATMLRLV